VEQDNAADAFVIACFSDPGLQVCREATRRPVFGISECGLLTALSRGDRFGVIAIQAASIARHRRYMREMGLTARFAGERPLGMTVAETASGEGTFARMEAVGRDLVEPAWRAIAARSNSRSASRWSTPPRRPSPWRSGRFRPNSCDANCRRVRRKALLVNGDKLHKFSGKIRPPLRRWP
jgi:hypothetical protein